MDNIKNIIFIASGKGGVGKSTVASNLAVALAREGFSTGLLDADLYGPSIPLALGIDKLHPEMKKEDSKDIITPFESYGVKVMSLGFLMNKQDPVIWRGPMASNALKQLLENTNWGPLEYLLIDMPPGTGDINITLAQRLPNAKALIVITPQQMAVADGIKAVNMFKSNGIDIEIMGIVENMSWFTPDKHPDEKYYLFGEGGGTRLANEAGVKLITKVPLVADIVKLGDTGQTIFSSENIIIKTAYEKLVDYILEESQVPNK